MALEVTALSSRLTLTVNTGTDEKGNPILRSRSFTGVKPASLDQDVYDTAQALGALQQHLVEEISRVNEDTLADNGV